MWQRCLPQDKRSGQLLGLIEWPSDLQHMDLILHVVGEPTAADSRTGTGAQVDDVHERVDAKVLTDAIDLHRAVSVVRHRIKCSWNLPSWGSGCRRRGTSARCPRWGSCRSYSGAAAGRR
jgi:hypothetical protein